MKKLILCVTLVLCMITTAVAFAAGSSQSILPEGYKLINNKLFIDGAEVQEIILRLNGKITTLTIPEYLQLLHREQQMQDSSLPFSNSKTQVKSNTMDNDAIRPFGMTDDWYRYDESYASSHNLHSTQRRRVSTVQYNGGAGEDSMSIELSTSVSADFDANLLSFEKNYVSSGASFSFSYSASYKETHKLTVPPKHYAWWEFTPYMSKTSGYMKTFSWLGEEKSKKWVTSYSPDKKNGSADGIFYSMKSKTAPNN